MSRCSRSLVCGWVVLSIGLAETLIAGDDAGPPVERPPSPTNQSQAWSERPPSPIPSGGVDVFEDPVELISPKIARNEQQQDAIKAAALFAHGRMLLQRRDELALRRYQRAWRYDPPLVSISEDIVPLAQSLRSALNQPQRMSERNRYLVLAAETEELTDQAMGIAAAWASQDDPEQAISIYEKLIARKEDSARDATFFESHFEIGRLRFRLGQTEQAATHLAKFQHAIEHPDDSGLSRPDLRKLRRDVDRKYRLIAEVYLRAEQLDQAEDAFRRAAGEDSAILASDLARVEHARGNIDEAIGQLEGYLAAKTASRGLVPYQLLELLLRKKIADEDAATKELLSRLEARLEHDPDNVPLRLYAAQRSLAEGELESAATSFLHLQKRRPSSEAYQGLAQIYRKQDDLARLIEVLASATRSGDFTLRRLGEVAEEIGADAPLVEKLRELVDQTNDEPPADQAARRMAVALLLLPHQVDVAQQQFEHALMDADSKDRVALRTSWGLALYADEQYDEAVRTFEQAISENRASDNAELYYFLSSALQSKDRIDEAVSAGKKAVALEPDSLRYQTHVPMILYRARRYDEARHRYESLLQRLDSNHDSFETRDRLRQVRLVLSHVCVELGDNAAGQEWLEQVLDEFPGDVSAANDLGYLWADQGKHLARALKMCQRAVASDPENTAYLDSLGWAHFRLGNLRKAIEYLQRAVDSEDDPDGVILDHLAEALAQDGQKEKAIELWKQAADSFKQNNNQTGLDRVTKRIGDLTP